MKIATHIGEQKLVELLNSSGYIKEWRKDAHRVSQGTLKDSDKLVVTRLEWVGHQGMFVATMEPAE